MSLRINGINDYSLKTYTNQNKFNRSNPNFNGLTSDFKRGIWIASAGVLLTLSSCSNKQKADTDGKDFEDATYVTKTGTSDSSDETTKQDAKPMKSYHFFPKDNNEVRAEDYDWSETIYPDGSREIDSLEYKISITPDGKRTEVKTERNEDNDLIKTTSLPDGSKIIVQQFNTAIPNKVTYIEKHFWPNGNLKESIYHNELPADSTNKDSVKNIQSNHFWYNENEVLLKWEDNFTDSLRNSSNNKYDKLKRLIYDDVTGEHYHYKGKDSVPSRSEAVFNSCKRITIYNDSGKVDKVYFEAVDGSITE